jgi:prepilin-type N-terminal cleavage/methylation domain-containing protein
MGWTMEAEDRGMAAGASGPGVAADRERGFTLVEVSTSVAVLLIVLTAAWLLLTVSNNNFNRIEGGGQASEINRAALAAFERDIGHAMLPPSGASAVMRAAERTCTIRADVNKDQVAELVTWTADDESHRLLRVVAAEGGATTTETVLTGLAPAADLVGGPMFSYAVDAYTAYAGDKDKIGLITFRLRNGLPDEETNVVERTAAFRVIAYVINGY